MSQSKLAVVLFVVAGLVVVGYVGYKLAGDSGTSGVALRSIEVSEVSQHSTAGDCWTIINGQVYDVTEFIASHPGGDEILRACGVDGTSLFTQRTTANGGPVGSGTPHSSSAASTLNGFLIGEVVH
jgi:hypothetical protein